MVSFLVLFSDFYYKVGSFLNLCMSVICMAQLSPAFCINSDGGRLDLFHFLLLLCIGVHGWEERRKTERSKAKQQSNGLSSSLSAINNHSTWMFSPTRWLQMGSVRSIWPPALKMAMVSNLMAKTALTATVSLKMAMTPPTVEKNTTQNLKPTNIITSEALAIGFLDKFNCFH